MSKRITSIDVLRGFALLGILVMNIMSFAMPSVAYFSPVAYDASIFNQIVYGLSHIFADQKFMAIFSMLFGASTLLFVNNTIKKGKRPTLLFYSRNWWLLIFGGMHFYFLWYGDILFVYALCSFFLYFMRKIPPKIQITIGLFIYLLPIATNYLTYEYVVDELSQAEQQVIIDHWNSTESTIQKELDVYRGAYSEHINHRLSMGAGSQKETEALVSEIKGLSLMLDVFSRAFGMMLIGMACFSWSVFSNSLRESTYKKMMIYGLGFGISLSTFGLFLNYWYGWDWKYTQFLGKIPNTLATPFTAFGYISLIMLWIRTAYINNLQDRLQAIGKTALTCYLLQSVIATFVFYGFGLGLFGYVNRLGQIVLMVVIWGVLLVLCPLWLKRFQYGPVEWFWRSLTYFKIVSIQKKDRTHTLN